MSENATPATEFAPGRHLTQPCQCDLQKNTQQDTSKVLRLPRKMTMDTSKVLRLPRKLQHIFWKRRKSIAPATQNDFQHVAKHVWMSRSATPATRNEATTRLKLPKMTTSAKLPIGTAIRSSYGRLRTVANGCGRLRTRTQRRANTPLTPRPPEWNGNPCYAFGKKHINKKTAATLENASRWISLDSTICFGLHLLDARYLGPIQFPPDWCGGKLKGQVLSLLEKGQSAQDFCGRKAAVLVVDTVVMHCHESWPWRRLVQIQCNNFSGKWVK